MVLREYTQRHRLDAVAPADCHRHLPEQVARGLPSAELVVFRVADEHSDTAAFSARYGFGLEDCANTLVLRYKRDGAEGYAAVVNLGSRRLDVNGAVKALLGARRLSFAAREVATELTGMQFGGITAFGLPEGMPLLVDAAVFERPLVVMGAGVRETKLLLSPALLKDLPGVVVAELSEAG
ncbi:TPA: YbaK/EbsC family protein [Pseudomonas aeruginosa]|nr:YbaK/EbsC family protein [Pseudomonas aeruginosa]HCG0576390.1 YbaK/EbsC family protein [Pseudomonas aeruginosa]HCG0582736.1 YbaK/EbsC family protein [Pseudomonas aeruginosa]HCG0590912.1 YbaK/EbsC family protein [Pseudomonas aeruginosa]HCG0670925.1 YbaK/EbsC family protein [Pseudomonas aeruginosa]